MFVASLSNAPHGHSNLTGITMKEHQIIGRDCPATLPENTFTAALDKVYADAVAARKISQVGEVITRKPFHRIVFLCVPTAKYVSVTSVVKLSDDEIVEHLEAIAQAKAAAKLAKAGQVAEAKTKTAAKKASEAVKTEPNAAAPSVAATNDIAPSAKPEDAPATNAAASSS